MIPEVVLKIPLLDQSKQWFYSKLYSYAKQIYSTENHWQKHKETSLTAIKIVYLKHSL